MEKYKLYYACIIKEKKSGLLHPNFKVSTIYVNTRDNLLYIFLLLNAILFTLFARMEVGLISKGSLYGTS